MTLVDELDIRRELKRAAGSTTDERRRYAASINTPLSELDLILQGASLPTSNVLRALGYERVTRYVKKPDLKRERKS